MQPSLPDFPAREAARRSLTAVPFLGFMTAAAIGFNAVQLARFALGSFDPERSTRVMRSAYRNWIRALSAGGRLAYDQEFVYSGDPLPDGLSVVVMANHQEMPDVPVIMELASQSGRGDAIKWFAKDSLKWIPGVGWSLFDLAVLVKRDWTRDQDTIRATFARLLDDPHPFWVTVFPEGTRVTPDKLATAQEFARSRGMDVPGYTLVPRPKGFIATVTGLRERLDEVIDVTIGYPGGIPTLPQYMMGGTPRVHVHLRRFPIAELPTDEEGLTVWLRERFVEKDARLERFYTTGVME